MADMSRDALLALARPGAAAKVAALQAELDAIYSVFPELKSDARKTSRAPAAPTPTATKGAPRAPRASQASWNAAARKAVSERMKRYWAGRRAQEAAGANAAPKATGAAATKAAKATKSQKPAKPAKAQK